MVSRLLPITLHGVHAEAPGLSENVFNGQSVHCDAPGKALYRPGGHLQKRKHQGPFALVEH
jgi:hypothetical protein